MTIKSTIENKTKVGLYPLLKKKKNDGLIVLFTSRTTGIVIYTPHKRYKIGESVTWNINHNILEDFEIFNDTITLQNTF